MGSSCIGCCWSVAIGWADAACVHQALLLLCCLCSMISAAGGALWCCLERAARPHRPRPLQQGLGGGEQSCMAGQHAEIDNLRSARAMKRAGMTTEAPHLGRCARAGAPARLRAPPQPRRLHRNKGGAMASACFGTGTWQGQAASNDHRLEAGAVEHPSWRRRQTWWPPGHLGPRPALRGQLTRGHRCRGGLLLSKMLSGSLPSGVQLRLIHG